MSISSLRIDEIADERPTLDGPATATTATAPADAEEAGFGALVTPRGNLPLHRLSVRAAITGLTVGVKLTQTFHNPFDVPLEATYIFPLPDRAAVTGLTMTAGDRVIEGVLSERGEARATYDAAIAAGQQASIAEEERPDVFTLRVGNILPGEEVTVAFTLVGPLPFADGQAEFRFPLVVAPRYIPGGALAGEQVGSGHARDTDAVPDASRISPPVMLPGFPNPVDLSIEARIDPAGLALAGIASSLHAVTEEDGLVRIQPGERVNRDFILRLAYEDGANALVLVPDPTSGRSADPATGRNADAGSVGNATDAAAADEVADGDVSEGTYQLTILPPATGTLNSTTTASAANTGGASAATASPKRARDLVLLLDRSGSMSGWKMVAARRAAARIVDTLTSGDRFAALTFDHTVEHPDRLPSGLVAATDRHRYRAIEHLARVDARGGTELAGPLHEALALLTDSSRDRVLVLVTDGQVGNEDQILREITPGLEGVRVHTVGIDSAVNAGFLGRLAGVGGGRCELVESEDRLDDAMDRIHRRIGSPSVTGLRIEAEGLSLIPGSASPARIPDLFPGVPLVITGRYKGAAGGALTVSGLTPDELPWQVVVPAAVADRPEVAKIWARGRLRDLEDQYTVNADADLENTIVETSLRHGVLCRFTAYVATDVKVVTDGAEPHRVTQLVEQPAGWEPVMDMAHEQFRGAPVPPSVSRPGGAPRPYSLSASAAPTPAMAMPFAAPMPPMPAARFAPISPSGQAKEAPKKLRKRSRGADAGDGGNGPVGAGGGGLAGAIPGGEKADLYGSALGGMFVVAAEVSEAFEPAFGGPEPFGPELVAVIAQAGLEARRLRDGAEEPMSRRRDLLDDLASRLDALTRDLTMRPTDRAAAETLTALVKVLRDTEMPLADRWARALKDLDELAALTNVAADTAAAKAPAAVDSAAANVAVTGVTGASGVADAAAGEAAPERRPFWKR